MPLRQPHSWVSFHPLPFEVTPVFASVVGGAGASFTLTLTGGVGSITYLTHLTVTCPNVAGVVSGLITLTGCSTTLNWQFVETVSAGGWLDHHFDPPVLSSALNTSIVLNVPAIGGGGAIAANMYGYLG
jgi:hypothetical protein